MVGTKGCSGGYRPGAGRRPGSTSIKKDKRKGKKQSFHVVANAPSAASATWFKALVQEAGRKAAEDKAQRLAAALAAKAANSQQP